MRLDTKTRLMRHVEMVPESGCWLWTGHLSPKGYGIFAVDSRTRSRAHRVAYEAFTGPIPSDRMVCHHCDVRCCVNPAHLYLGTHADNMRDRAERKRQRAGDAHWTRKHPFPYAGDNAFNRKLTSDQVKEIRQSTKSQRALSKQFGISRHQVLRILRRESWKGVA